MRGIVQQGCRWRRAARVAGREVAVRRAKRVRGWARSTAWAGAAAGVRGGGVRGRLSPGSSAHGEAAARWQQCGRRAGGRSRRWGDGVAWCCDSGALCACIVIVCIHQQQGMVVVWRALVGRAGASLGDRRVDVSPGSGARGLHAGRPLGGRRTLSRVRAAGAVAAETTRLAGWLSRWRRASAIRPHTNTP